MVCPKCENADQIQKLSSIVSSNTQKTTGVSTTTKQTNLSGRQEYYSRDNRYTGKGNVTGQAHSVSTTMVDSVNQSDLARNLMPPPEPIEPVQFRIGILDRYDNIKIVAIIGLGILMLCVFFAIGVIINDLLLHVVPHVILELEIIVLPAIGLILGMRLGFKLINRYREKMPFVSKADIKQKDYERQQSLYTQNFSEWQKAYSRWKDTYYCFRDDVIFIPATTEMTTPENTIHFCYRQKAE